MYYCSLSYYSSVIQLIISLNVVYSWNLSILNITDYRILHVSVYYSRAFLSIESNNKRFIIPTLVEGSWPENQFGVITKIFPNDNLYSKSSNDCRYVVQAKCSDIDVRGRLWVLDNGTPFCKPKLILYNLLNRNEEVLVHIFAGKKDRLNFSSLLIDPVVTEENDLRAYISSHDEDFIIIFSLKQKKVIKLKFTNNQILPNNNNKLSLPEMVITPDNIMYLSDSRTGNLYSLNMTPVRYINFTKVLKKKIFLKTSLTFVGMLLGPPKSIVMHPKRFLFYILPRDGAIVTWDIHFPLSAEWHEVIFQRSMNITQIVFGWKGSVWGVSSNLIDQNEFRARHCVKIYN